MPFSRMLRVCVCVWGGPLDRSNMLTRSGDLGGWNFSDKAKGLLGGHRVGVSGDAGEDFKSVNLKINEKLQY